MPRSHQHLRMLRIVADTIRSNPQKFVNEFTYDNYL